MRMQASIFCLALMAFSLTSCVDTGRSNRGNPPSSPRQEPGPNLREQSAGQQAVERTLQTLQDTRNAIEREMDTWRMTTKTAGPRLGSETATLKRRILDLCEGLERDTQTLQGKPYLREHRGAAAKTDDYLRFVERTRSELQRR